MRTYITARKKLRHRVLACVAVVCGLVGTTAAAAQAGPATAPLAAAVAVGESSTVSRDVFFFDMVSRGPAADGSGRETIVKASWAMWHTGHWTRTVFVDGKINERESSWGILDAERHKTLRSMLADPVVAEAAKVSPFNVGCSGNTMDFHLEIGDLELDLNNVCQSFPADMTKGWSQAQIEGAAVTNALVQFFLQSKFPEYGHIDH